MPKNYTLKLQEIQTFAKKITPGLKGGEIFALVGTLGAGKTTFVKAVGKQLKIKQTITSPTFVLLNRFETKSTAKTKELVVYHLDLYRTKDFKEVKALGLTEFWGKPKTVTFIEWADKIKKHLPAKTIFITFQN